MNPLRWYLFNKNIINMSPKDLENLKDEVLKLARSRKDINPVPFKKEILPNIVSCDVGQGLGHFIAARMGEEYNPVSKSDIDRYNGSLLRRGGYIERDKDGILKIVTTGTKVLRQVIETYYYPDSEKGNDMIYTQTPWDVLTKLSAKFEVTSFINLPKDLMQMLIDINLADEMSLSRYKKNFIKLSEDEMETLINENPELLVNEAKAMYINTLTESVSFSEYTDWVEAIHKRYPQLFSKMKFKGYSEKGGNTVSAEIPGEDRSYGVWDLGNGSGSVLESDLMEISDDRIQLLRSQIDRALKSKNPQERANAFNSQYVTPAHIAFGMKDSEPLVRIAAINHENATPEQIRKAHYDDNNQVRIAAAHHKNASLTSLKKAIKDVNVAVSKAGHNTLKGRSIVLENFKSVLKENISKGLKNV